MCVSLKLSQGAKPGIGGVLPGAKQEGQPDDRADSALSRGGA
jgi:hypothetical protein